MLGGRQTAPTARLCRTPCAVVNQCHRGESPAPKHSAALQRLAVFYDTNVLSFFGGEQQAGKLVRPDQRIELSSEPGVHLELLAFGSTAMEPHLFRLAPGTSSGGSYHHEGEEFIFVISGNCDVWLDEVECHLLQQGDSFWFESNRGHRWFNPTNKEAAGLWVNTPPTF